MQTMLHKQLSYNTAPAINSSQASAKDFVTLLKPGVMSLVVYTGLVGIIIAPDTMHPFLVFVVILSIALGSGSAAAFNMWYDQDIDALMFRTQKRPIPLGKIAPHDALGFSIILSVASVVLMAFASNWLAALLLAFSIFYYNVIYTVWLKRSTAQNIVIGGAAGAFPPMIGWCAVTGSISMDSFILFLLIFLWTPSHFWSLAILKAQDYKTAGIPMLPVRKGIPYTTKQVLLYSFALIVCSGLPIFIHMSGWLYGAFAFVLDGIYLYYAVQVYRNPTQATCKTLFLYSIVYLFLLFSAITLDVYLRGLL